MLIDSEDSTVPTSTIYLWVFLVKRLCNQEFQQTWRSHTRKLALQYNKNRWQQFHACLVETKRKNAIENCQIAHYVQDEADAATMHQNEHLKSDEMQPDRTQRCTQPTRQIICCTRFTAYFPISHAGIYHLYH